MEQLVVNGKALPVGELRAAYAEAFMATMGFIATRRRHANVLKHMRGHLRKKLDDESFCEIASLIDDYGAGLIPLLVPITRIRDHARRLQIDCLMGQLYLEPHPNESMLRNRSSWVDPRDSEF